MPPKDLEQQPDDTKKKFSLHLAIITLLLTFVVYITVIAKDLGRNEQRITGLEAEQRDMKQELKEWRQEMRDAFDKLDKKLDKQ